MRRVRKAWAVSMAAAASSRAAEQAGSRPALMKASMPAFAFTEGSASQL